MEPVSFVWYVVDVLQSRPEIAPFLAILMIAIILWRYSYIPSLIQNLKKTSEENKLKIDMIDKLECEINQIKNEMVPASLFKSENEKQKDNRARLDEIAKELANLRGSFESTTNGLEKAIEKLNQLMLSLINKK
jgi:Sec-independent protein translocase protein TatA